MVEDIQTMSLVQRMLYHKIEIIKQEMAINFESIELIPLIEDAMIQVKVDYFLNEFFKNIPIGRRS